MLSRQVSIKRFLKINLADVGMVQCVNALADKGHKQEVPCYEVHITVCMAHLVCVLCQPVHSCIEPSLHQLDFILEIFLWRHVSVINFFQFITQCHSCTCDWCTILVCVHRWMTSNIQYTLPSQSSPQESANGKYQLCSKQSSNTPSPEIFLTNGAISNATRIALWH